MNKVLRVLCMSGFVGALMASAVGYGADSSQSVEQLRAQVKSDKQKLSDDKSKNSPDVAQDKAQLKADRAKLHAQKKLVHQESNAQPNAQPNKGE